MNKSKILIIILILIVENIALWYVANFYYQYMAQERRVASKIGQVEGCKNISNSEFLLSVLVKMGKYYPDLIYVDSMGRIKLSYGSEFSKGFAIGAGTGFDFDESYKLIKKSCEGLSMPE